MPETVYMYDIVFHFHSLHVVNYKSVKWEPFSVDLIKGAEFKNLSSTSTVMKWKTDVYSL